MLEEIYEYDESLTTDNYYDALYYILGDAYPNLSDEELEDLLEDTLARLPEPYAEGVLDTIGNIGKSIGSGALAVGSGAVDIAVKNPELTQFAATAAGTAIGGPLGGKIGYEASKALVPGKAAPAAPLQATGKTLAIMQNPQAQAAMTRATLGIGNGTAPLSQNGNVNLIPVATYLRALIVSAQQALMELDRNNVIPAPAFSESMPYSYDVDMQAEWLAEQLVQ